jgi:HupE / UreJ protein
MDTILIYLQLGFEHILPLGFDHVLFILCLFFSAVNLKSILWQSAAFTLAHSISLALVMLEFIPTSSTLVEPMITISIVFAAVANIATDKLIKTRILLVLLFGLIHGLGFARALNDMGLKERQFFKSLISFNIGVEFGQLTVILAAWLLIGKWLHKKIWYRRRIVIPISTTIAVIAVYWTIERIYWG